MKLILSLCLVSLTGCAHWKVMSKDDFQTIYTDGNNMKICHGDKGDDNCSYIYRLPNGQVRICEYGKPCEEMTSENFLSHFF